MKTIVSIMIAAAVATAMSATAQAQKNPPGVNPTHYQCYRVTEKEPPFRPREVKLHDQFGSSVAKVLKPLFLCAPTDKNDLKARDTKTHYVCYEDEGPKTPERTALITNQFGKEVLVVGGAFVLCVPSTKVLQK